MPISVTQVSPSQQERTGKAFVDYAKRFSIKCTDLDASNQYYIPLEAGQTVLAVRMFVKTAYGAVTLAVGDSSGSVVYALPGMLNPNTLSAFTNTSAGSSAGKGGKYYAATDYLVFTASGSSATGELIANVIFDGYGTGPGRDEIKNLS